MSQNESIQEQLNLNDLKFTSNFQKIVHLAKTFEQDVRVELDDLWHQLLTSQKTSSLETTLPSPPIAVNPVFHQFMFLVVLHPWTWRIYLQFISLYPESWSWHLESSFDKGLFIIFPDFKTKSTIGHNNIYFDAIPINQSIPMNLFKD